MLWARICLRKLVGLRMFHCFSPSLLFPFFPLFFWVPGSRISAWESLCHAWWLCRSDPSISSPKHADAVWVTKTQGWSEHERCEKTRVVRFYRGTVELMRRTRTFMALTTPSLTSQMTKLSLGLGSFRRFTSFNWFTISLLTTPTGSWHPHSEWSWKMAILSFFGLGIRRRDQPMWCQRFVVQPVAASG